LNIKPNLIGQSFNFARLEVKSFGLLDAFLVDYPDYVHPLMRQLESRENMNGNSNLWQRNGQWQSQPIASGNPSSTLLELRKTAALARDSITMRIVLALPSRFISYETG